MKAIILIVTVWFESAPMPLVQIDFPAPRKEAFAGVAFTFPGTEECEAYYNSRLSTYEAGYGQFGKVNLIDGNCLDVTAIIPKDPSEAGI